MRIAMVSEHASPLASPGTGNWGGQNVHVAALSAALARRGHEVTVYARRDDADLPEGMISGDGYQVVHVAAGPPRRLPKDAVMPHMTEFARFLRTEWSREAPDVAHAHFWTSGIATQLVSRVLGTRTIQTFHVLGSLEHSAGATSGASPDGRIRTERAIARAASRIIAASSEEAFELARMGVPGTRISRVPCGVDLDLFTPSGQRERPAGRRKRVVSVGRLAPGKGFDIAIEAVARIPAAELVIAGGPDGAGAKGSGEARRLRALARNLGCEQRVHLLGQVPRDRMPELLRTADAVLCTPRYESFGMVPLEAMACGVPVVAHAVGGVLDTVIDGVTGVLVPPHRPRLLVSALREVLSRPAFAEGLGIAGRDRAVARYSWDQIATETEHAYQRAALAPAGSLDRSS
ncbi:glycosyltransferase [Hoyosella sp. G463]|uniref:Glycosyltransferase n=1 Tax=Lolliginicoccus lacisalsi TaxID=2742202 RepID=A0A927JC53_9ACTN|nr:glycosyltransferase [Lolliginicoccus lacisalsi]MBD8506455.1 glycosyltransferase [Lolliginicoccus lacisalsi]